MANIMEYMDWRGDVPFSMDPFNEVDNLILAQMSYTDFDGFIADNESKSIRTVSEAYFNKHTVEEIEGRDTFYRLAPLVMKKASETKRFGDIMIENYINVLDVDKEEQMAAVTFTIPGYISYVAFRGTDNTLVGWKEDFNLSYMLETPGQKRAVRYLNEQYKRKDEKIIVGGHSKGGNFAVYASAFSDDEIKEKIIKIYTNDGPGFRREVLGSKEYQGILDRIESIIPEESMVGILLENSFGSKIVKSSARGINQHDPMTWQVYVNKFFEVENLAGKSRFMNETVSNWLSELDDEKRARFIDIVFSVLSATGAETLEEVTGSGVKGLSQSIKLLAGLPKEEQAEFTDMLKKLVATGGGLIFDKIRKK